MLGSLYVKWMEPSFGKLGEKRTFGNGHSGEFGTRSDQII